MVKKSLIVKGSGGGLGDSIRSVLCGLIYAYLSGRDIFIDWTHGLFTPERHNAFPKLFNVSCVRQLNEMPVEGSVFPSAWSGRLTSSLHEVYWSDGPNGWNRKKAIQDYSFDMSIREYTEDILVMWEFDQMDKLRGKIEDKSMVHDDIEIMKYAYRKFLRIDYGIEERVNDCWRTYCGDEVIGVHVRMTDEFAMNKGGIELKDYHKTLDKVLANHPHAKLFLATDNIACINDFRSRYPRVVVRDKWFPHAGEAIHFDKSSPDILRNTEDALIEMLLLARCDLLIRPVHSSFSLISQVFSDRSENEEILLFPRTNVRRKLILGLKRRLWP